eukprot:m.796557 g.796557  ORF g.796557 m.796557 type:complete len:141 (+) comp59246_c0_seq1:115-537(+)
MQFVCTCTSFPANVNGVKVPPDIVRKRISFWISQGFIKETSKGVFELAQDGDTEESGELVDEEEEEEEEEEEDEDMQMYWAFIFGMLTNLGPQPLQKILSMLQMVAQGDQSDIEKRLREFLQAKIQNEELLFVNNAYKLP